MMSLYQFLGGRKYAALYAILVVGSYLSYHDKLDMNLVYLMLAAYGMYCGGNVGSKFSIGRLSMDVKNKK